MKNTLKTQGEEAEKKGFFSDISKEFKEVFSERINIIIVAGTFFIGGASVGGIVLYEKLKDSQEEQKENIETPESLEIRGKHKIILERSTQEIPPSKQSEETKNSSSPHTVENIAPSSHEMKNDRKEALREEILSSGSATIGNNPEDIKNLADLINETLNGQKRK